MPTETQLLDSLTNGSPRLARAVCTTLGEILSPLSRSYYERSTRTDHERLSAEHCLIVESHQVRSYHFHLGGQERWATLGAVREAFERRNAAHRSGAVVAARHTSPLPGDLVLSDAKLIIRDTRPIQSVVTSDYVYPKRAWVGILHPSFGREWYFVLAGILNSAIGQVLYNRRARERGRDLRKGALSDIRIPLLEYDEEAFDRAALLSYRLHSLYAAERECRLAAEVIDVDISNHRLQLLSELARLYGYSEREARMLVQEVLPRGLEDVRGDQASLLYLPRSPLRGVELLDAAAQERYEELKAVVRGGSLGPAKVELEELQHRLEWEERINSPMPSRLRPTPWPGAATEEAAIRAAERFLSNKRGQPFYAEEAERINDRRWQVRVYYSPPKGLTATNARRVPVEWTVPGKHFAGTLWIDAVTGEVTEATEAAAHAVTP